MPDKSFIENLGMSTATSAADSAVGAAMGLLLEKHNDRRQIKQQQKLTDMQLNANKGMADYNRQMQMQMWKDTNYGPQMLELEKAGLNPGLIYGMSGGGATTTGSGGGSGVSGAMAPSGGGEAMGLMMQKMQIGLMEAQRQNIEANTNKTEAETGNVPLTGENIKASTASITQGITNQKTQNALMEAQTAATNINTENIQTQTKLIENQIEIMENDVEISNATKEDKITQIKQIAINTAIQADAMKTGISVDKAAIHKMSADIAQGWEALSNQEKQITIQKSMADLNIQYAPIDRVIKAVDGVVNGVSQFRRAGNQPKLERSIGTYSDGGTYDKFYK